MREVHVNVAKILVLDACLQNVGKGISERRLQVVYSE